jgi:hypothetical protein
MTSTSRPTTPRKAPDASNPKNDIGTTPTAPDRENLKSTAECCSRQIAGWAQSLQNPAIAGPRNLNERSRNEYIKRQARKQGALAPPATARPPPSARPTRTTRASSRGLISNFRAQI